MSIYKDAEFSWGGLNTRAASTGLPVMESTVLQDLRVVGRDLVQRLGIARVCQYTGNFKAGDLDRASSENYSAAIDARVWTLGTQFTIEVLLFPETVPAATVVVFHAGTTNSSIVLSVNGLSTFHYAWGVTDSATTVVAVDGGLCTAALTSLQLTRDGATLTARLNNVVSGTNTMSATLPCQTTTGNLDVGGLTGFATTMFDGKIDQLRVLSIAKSNHNDRLIRLPNPRSSYVLADYDFNESAGGIIYDRSRYENHLVTANTPTEVATLSHNPAPIRALSMTADPSTNRKALLTLAGGNYFIADID